MDGDQWFLSQQNSRNLSFTAALLCGPYIQIWTVPWHPSSPDNIHGQSGPVFTYQQLMLELELKLELELEKMCRLVDQAVGATARTKQVRPAWISKSWS